MALGEKLNGAESLGMSKTFKVMDEGLTSRRVK